MTEIENYYSNQPEPIKGTLLALKEIVLSQDKNISHEWKYGMPFFCYKGKMFCYLWVHKKYKQPYIGIVEGQRFNDPDLLQESRSRMKIMLLNPEIDLPIKKIKNLLKKVLTLYQSGIIKLPKVSSANKIIP
ncbi:MAG: DUF1801 domain-containing protein [Saprospiraceae bacterium]|nr:DUF1801 domain-containing protein [Saprospiraceae bacterium]MBL0084546.1 DUF1801 domain-containing protein [Saprospiraceae bacterium]